MDAIYKESDHDLLNYIEATIKKRFKIYVMFEFGLD